MRPAACRFLFLFILALLIFVRPALAQDCYSYFPTDEGATFTITHYNPKGKVESISEYTVKEYNETATGYDITIHLRSSDKKGNNPIESTFSASCNDGIFQVDMAAMINNMDQMKNMEMKIKGDMISLPSALSIGQSLPDASMEMEAEGPMPMKFKIDMVNRKVAGQEEISTPAGSFDCYVITYDQKMKTVMNMETSSKQWLNPEVGMVRSEYYNKNGKMMGYSELTSLSR